MANKYRRALWRLDHTLCMNNLKNNIEFNIDSPEDYPDGGYDPDDTDCKTAEDMIQCLEDIEEALDLLDLLFEHAEYQTHPDPFFYLEMPERIIIDIRKLVDTPSLLDGPHDFTENNKGFKLIKQYFMEAQHKTEEDLK